MPGSFKQGKQFSAGKSELPPSISCPVCKANHVPLKGDLSNGVYATTCQNCGFFFKFRASHDVSTSVSFTVNGKEYTVGNEWPLTTSLNTYLRKSGISRGTKNSCYQGGCGTCLVVVSLYNSLEQTNKEYAVNSCLMGLYSCDGLAITTIEGLGNPRTGLHPIQKTLAEKDGAQCGFCSNGQVMNMYGLLKSNDNSVTVQEIEDKFDGVLCRCTGYRSILDAMRTFATDAPPGQRQVIDIEELDGKLCKKSGKACSGHCSEKGAKGCSNRTPRPLHMVNSGKQWLRPVDLASLLELLNTHREDKYRLVQGNTAHGIFPQLDLAEFDVLIDIRNVSELYIIDYGNNVLIGANVSINQLQQICSTSESDPTRFWAPAFAEHLKYISGDAIRNIAGWGGNLMIKHQFRGYKSDIFLCLEAAGALIQISDGDGSQQNYNLLDFLDLDMRGKVITAMLLPTSPDSDVYMRSFRSSLRLQACGSDVNAAFRFKLDAANNFRVKEKPSIVLGGISATFIHATQTEDYLVGKELGNPSVLQGALNKLKAELVPDSRGRSPAFRKSLGLGFFYKAVLDICKTKVSPRFQSGGTQLKRVPMKGTQDYSTNASMFPVTKPMMKTTAEYLTSGVAEYLDDFEETRDTLYAGVVVTDIANGEIDTIDASAALALPGVTAFFQASDIPGQNNWRPVGIFGPTSAEELLCSGPIQYAGQPVGVLVAEDEVLSRRAARLVNVTYKNVKTPIVDLQDAINKESFHVPGRKPLKTGDAAAAIASAPHKISGTVSCGAQAQFYLENNIAICRPTDEGGIHCQATSQWLDGNSGTISQILGIHNSKVNVEVKRLGGGFGGKITQNFRFGGMAALAAYILNKPVKLKEDSTTDMRITGKRPGYVAKYRLGATNEGKLLGVELDLYLDMGATYVDFESNVTRIEFFDNAYYCENWTVSPIIVKTNKCTNTACRSPASVQHIFIIESVMDHLAKSLGLDPLIVRQRNLYKRNQVEPNGRTLEYCNIKEVVEKLKTDLNYAQRKADVDRFNQENRWKKRGLVLVPNRWSVVWNLANYTTAVMVYHEDGSVGVAHGGIDMGQGINTKVMQAVAHEFGIPVSKISCKRSSTTINSNSIVTGGSVGTELCILGAIRAARIIKERMDVVKKTLVNPSWEQLVFECFVRQVKLSASSMPATFDEHDSHYSCYSAACVEAEIDVLTGQNHLRQLDLLYDCGESTNPELDIGQCEGAFVMGIGYFFIEDPNYDLTTGLLTNSGVSRYKAPLPKDLPLKFNINFRRNAPNPLGVLGAKAVAEPPVAISSVSLLAVKNAIEAAREELGNREFFTLNAPATSERVEALCLNDTTKYTYGP